MRIGIPREEQPGETLVAATPKTAAQLVALGYEVVVESGAGAAATFADEAYLAAGAAIGSSAEVWAADVVLKVNEPSPAEIARLGRGRDSHRPDDAGRPSGADRGAAGQTGDRLEPVGAIPRISRAQSMDVLSTMSNIAGYRGVIEAAESYGGMFAGQVTAAGKTQPATVFIIGAGVARVWPRSAPRSAWARRSGRSTCGPRWRADRVDGRDIRAGGRARSRRCPPTGTRRS